MTSCLEARKANSFVQGKSTLIQVQNAKPNGRDLQNKSLILSCSISKCSVCLKMEHWIWWLVGFVISYVIIKIYNHINYFKKYGIPHPREIPYLGCMGASLISITHVNDSTKYIYNINRDAKYVGAHAFTKPIIFIRDLDLIKNLLVTNFDHFPNQQNLIDESVDPLFALNLSSLRGDKWHEVRTLLSPAFTSSKMRAMFVLMSNCAENFVKTFLHLYKDKEAIDIKDVWTRYANDVIGTCAFGIEIDSLKDPNNEFYLTGRRSTTFEFAAFIKLSLIRTFPELMKSIGLRFVSKKDTEFFVNLVESTIKARDEQGIKRPDILQLMMDERGKEKSLNIIEIAAQAFVFFLGGFDTTANHASLIAYELAINPEIQTKLQEEIDSVMEEHNGKPTYEAINNMKYIDAVFAETMRFHSLAFLMRECAKDFELPPALPGSKPYIIKKGEEIMIPVSGIYHDPNYYDDPERFNPERFLNKRAMTSDVTSLGFGLGPRMCIGSRFAILETKVLLVYLLSKCTLEPCKKTSIPIVYKTSKFTATPKGGFWLKTKLRN